jgi:hypothetical protein
LLIPARYVMPRLPAALFGSDRLCRGPVDDRR